MNLLPRDGERPLSTAVRVESPDLVTALIQAGADPEAENQNGETPIRLASERGVAGVITALTNGMQKDKPGVIEDHFDILEELGAGAYARVFRAKRKATRNNMYLQGWRGGGSEVAVKRIDRSGLEAEDREMLNGEVGIMMRLEHPRCLTILEA